MANFGHLAVQCQESMVSKSTRSNHPEMFSFSTNFGEQNKADSANGQPLNFWGLHI